MSATDSRPRGWVVSYAEGWSVHVPVRAVLLVDLEVAAVMREAALRRLAFPNGSSSVVMDVYRLVFGETPTPL